MGLKPHARQIARRYATGCQPRYICGVATTDFIALGFNPMHKRKWVFISMQGVIPMQKRRMFVY